MSRSLVDCPDDAEVVLWARKAIDDINHRRVEDDPDLTFGVTSEEIARATFYASGNPDWAPGWVPQAIASTRSSRR